MTRKEATNIRDETESQRIRREALRLLNDYEPSIKYAKALGKSDPHGYVVREVASTIIPPRYWNGGDEELLAIQIVSEVFAGKLNNAEKREELVTA